jgi:DNA adenine methylase
MLSLSPLRYPGGKSRFVPLIAQAIDTLEKQPTIFVEAFCGGAGVSLAMLECRYADRIALNDADPLIASFWQVIFGKGDASQTDFDWLLRQIELAPITLEAWRDQKALQPTTLREAAWKCLFLNRTSFNGILHKSGPIGGWKQENRTLDVRFNREKLTSNLCYLRSLRGKVERVENLDWRPFCTLYRLRYRSYLYLDPPYYHRAEQLYGYLFDEVQHKAMRDYLLLRKAPWLLSYDDAAEVRALYSTYSNIDARVVDQTYSTHPMGGASFVGRELLFSNRAFPTAPLKGSTGPHVGLSVIGGLDAVESPQIGPARTRINKSQSVPLFCG